MNENMYQNNELTPIYSAIEKTEMGPKQESELVRNILSDFSNFGFISILYGIFYCFCLFENSGGITSPLWAIASFAYFVYAIKHFQITLHKSVYFYGAAIVLLGISNCLTTSEPIRFFNYIAIFLLLLLFVIKHFYIQTNWNVLHYFGAILCTVFGSLECFGGFFKSFSMFYKAHKTEKSNPVFKQIFIGLFISIPLLLVTGSLLISADAIFASVMIDSLFDHIVIPGKFIKIIFMTAVGIIAPYSIFLFLAKQEFTDEKPANKNGEAVIAITFCSTLTLLYLVFCFIQIRYLFFGQAKLSLPEGYTYAEYARQGFFQLLFVSILNLCLVTFCLHFYKDNKLLKGILTVISLCTFIMIASSALRMILYIKAYQLTFLRVLVLWALLVIFLLMCGVIFYTFREEFPLFSYGVIVISCLYIALSLSRPDTYIASYNIAKAQTASAEKIDFSYLYELSTDAAPILAKHGYLPSSKLENKTENAAYNTISEADCLNECEYYRKHIFKDYEEMGIREFNFSIYQAKKAITTE